MEGGIMPTVVIGVGEAGTKMAVALHKLVKEEGAGEYFKFVSVDSNEIDLNTNTPEEIKERVVLNTPPLERVKEDKRRYGYLYEGVDITGEGAVRQRVVGRYLVDNEWNYDKVYKTLSRTINDFTEKYQSILTGKQESSLNIWLLHSLGGGTGSGTFPLIAAFVQEIMAGVDKNFGVKPFFFGVGCLSSVPEDFRRGHVSGQPIYYANSLAAMKELKKMKESQELEIPLYATGGEPIKMKGFPFYKYFLIGINEEEAGRVKTEWVESHIEQKNNVVANCIYALSRLRGLENWYPHLNTGSFGEHELGVQMDVVRSYVELKDELKKLNVRLEEIKEGIKEKGESLKSLNDVSLNPKEIEEGNAEDIRKKVKGEFAGKDLAKLSEVDLDILFKEVKRVQDLEGARFVVDELDEKIKEAPHKLKWKEVVEDLWARHAMTTEYPNIARIEDKHAKLLGTLKRRIEDDKRWLANPPLMRAPWDTKKKREEKLKKTKGEERKLEDAKEDCDQIIKLEGKIGTLRSEIKKEMDDKTIEIKEAIRDLESEKDKVEEGINAKEMDISGRERDLGKSKFGRLGYLEIKENLDGLTKAEIEKLTSLKEVIKRGYVKREDVEKGLKKQISNAARWSNIAPKKKAKLDLFFVCKEENKELITLPSEATADFETTKGPHTGDDFLTEDKYKIKMCVYRNGIEIEDVREYEELKGLYDSKRLSEMLGVEVGEAFAYPEWFEEDENVKGVFKMR
jgi:hypothetical protein